MPHINHTLQYFAWWHFIITFLIFMLCFCFEQEALINRYCLNQVQTAWWRSPTYDRLLIWAVQKIIGKSLLEQNDMPMILVGPGIIALGLFFPSVMTPVFLLLILQKFMCFWTYKHMGGEFGRFRLVHYTGIDVR